MTGSFVTTGAVRPSHAMVLTAGLGLRMRPLSAHRPKPLIEVAGRSMLDRAIDRLQRAGVEEIVVNAHYLAGQIADHLAERAAGEKAAGNGPGSARLVISPEAERLETGGGVAQALPLLGARAFYVVNGDVLWLDGSRPALARLASAWDDAGMDALLLLHETATAFGYDGEGDFVIAADGRLRRRAPGTAAPMLFAGLQILSPRLFADLPAPAFSLNILYDHAAAAGRLFGIAHDGEWFHIGTPEDLALAEAELGRRETAVGQR